MEQRNQKKRIECEVPQEPQMAQDKFTDDRNPNKSEVQNICSIRRLVYSPMLPSPTSVDLVRIPLAKPMVHMPKAMGTSKRLIRSMEKTFHVRRRNANAVPIPEIMNKAANRHWCIRNAGRDS